MVAEQIIDLIDFGFHFLSVVAVYHGEQVIVPNRQMAGTLVTVADEIQLADDIAHFDDLVVVDIPHRHAVCGDPESIMIGHRADAADDAAG